MSPHFLSMTEIIEKVTAYLAPLLDGTDMFIVSIKVKPVNNIKVFLDADSGFSIEKASSTNRRLYAQIDAEQLFPDGDFSLEVSSPGVDEPLVNMRQYMKNVGRTVAVVLKDGTSKTGIMTEATDENIVLEIKVPKQKEPTVVAIPMAEIKTTTVQITF